MALTQQNSLTLYLRVRYGECDAQGVVFNARFADYADIAATEYQRAVVGDYQNLIEAGADNQVVSMQIDWKTFAKFDDVLALKVSTSHVGKTSFEFTILCQKRVENDTWLDVAHMRLSYVMVDTTHYQKMPIIDALKAGFSTPFTKTINQSGETI
uniref:acyl-CoA thioesterase n=1 Tax=Ningiella ruwaisensis TaxID=2364274 RepID=UPI00109FD00A|nr:hotdog domain-containing protein [Ningiella ruwaisensis]